MTQALQQLGPDSRSSTPYERTGVSLHSQKQTKELIQIQQSLFETAASVECNVYCT
jgi:hypothetical protein